METNVTINVPAKRGAEDSGKYFKYMADFVGFTSADADIIRQTKPIIEKHLPEIVSKFYSHLLRYPPTRKFFLKKDGSVDQDYVELRMRHLTNFWLRTADGVFDDDYARYVDYVGRAHTSHGADPKIYIAERYVIGQVGFIAHAISEALTKELRHQDEEFEIRAIEAWDNLMMVILEMLSRAYGTEREAETFDALVPIDQGAVEQLAEEAFEREHAGQKPIALKKIRVAQTDEIPEGERKLVQVDTLSIAVFHYEGKWYALRNMCLHRGGPVGTGQLANCTLTCPWHGFQYDITDGHLLVDPNAKLDTYEVIEENGAIHLQVPDIHSVPIQASTKPNEFRVNEVKPGQSRLIQVDGENVAVYNVSGTFYATQDTCTHRGGSLSDGTLDGTMIICPIHGSCFDVTTGDVLQGPANKPLKTYHVIIEGELAHVE